MGTGSGRRGGIGGRHGRGWLDDLKGYFRRWIAGLGFNASGKGCKAEGCKYDTNNTLHGQNYTNIASQRRNQCPFWIPGLGWFSQSSQLSPILG